jgi:hypothetical protein
VGSRKGKAVENREKTKSVESAKSEEIKIAFALGGLGGNNAHGAGLLQAALDLNIKPQIISFTSGQVLWVYRYLMALNASPQQDVLQAQLIDDIEKLEPFHQPDLDLMTLNLFGKSDAIRPARHEAFFDVLKNMMGCFERMIESPQRVFFIKEFFSTFPARQMVMQFSDSFFQTMSDAFNACRDIGLAFNSFDPNEGMEIVHLNDKARTLMKKKTGTRSSYRSRTIYKDITPNYVRNALWIYQYGFEDNNMLDGAYYRQIILSEITPAETIFVARPVSYKWLGKLPSSWAEVEDMKLEMSFNGSYQGERDKVELINNLINDGTLKNTKYKLVNLKEIEPETQESYFDYIFENIDIFKRSRKNALKEFHDTKCAVPAS